MTWQTSKIWLVTFNKSHKLLQICKIIHLWQAIWWVKKSIMHHYSNSNQQMKIRQLDMGQTSHDKTKLSIQANKQLGKDIRKNWDSKWRSKRQRRKLKSKNWNSKMKRWKEGFSKNKHKFTTERLLKLLRKGKESHLLLKIKVVQSEGTNLSQVRKIMV